MENISYIDFWLFVRRGGLLVILMVAAATDARKGIIPNKLILAGIGIWLAGTFWLGHEPGDSLFAAFAAGGCVVAIRWAGFALTGRHGMGLGDAKLLFVVGLYLQWEVFWVFYLAVLAGTAWSLTGIMLNRMDRKSKIPFAPFILAGGLVALFLLPFETVYELWM